MGLCRCIQINLHHAKAATAVLASRFSKEHLDIALIQEPYFFKDQIRGLPKGELLYNSSDPGIPRAGILFKKGLNYFPISGFCKKDLVAALIELPTEGGKIEIVICSAYLPGEVSDPISDDLKDLVNFCKLNNKQLLIGGDANAHHTIWGSSNINNRGECLVDFMISNSLELLNRGNKPTFINKIRQEVLDITLCSSFICDKITDWHVSQETSMSDHQHIRYNIHSDISISMTFRRPRLTDWNSYTENLKESLADYKPNVRDIDSLEIATSKLRDSIISAYHQSSSESTLNSNRKVPWWNSKLAQLRSQTRKLFNKAKATGGWEPYKESLTEYNLEIRRAKRASWKKYCGELNDLPSSAKLHKILSKQHTNKIGLMEYPDGSVTKNCRETLKLLANTHFPGSTTLDPSEVHSQSGSNFIRPVTEDWRLATKIFTANKVKWAIESFKPYKSPGDDGIFPALLQRGFDIVLPTILKIFRASHAWGYIPSAWRTVKVTYIPKAGKRPSAQPKSFRPISLISFLQKTMEKILDRHIREKVLPRSPLHKNQYAYLPGKSTTHALQNLIGKIEKSLSIKEQALCSFLDIEGAFDNTSFDCISRSISRKGVDLSTCKWIESMLKSRTIKSTIADESLTVSVAKGCPQGGVLSPILWSIVVDELLVILDNAGIDSQGYADDIAIIVRGKFNNTISEIMQHAFNLVEKWCIETELRINPKKSTIVLFTKSRSRENLTKPTLFGELVDFSNEVKFLGITLDDKLRWNSHLDKVINKARVALWTCKSLVGHNWGLQPNIAHWLYTSVVRPIITYAAPVWWLKTEQKTVQLKLQKIQRMACLGITGAMRTTPSSALEVLLDLPPLHLQIQKEARIFNYKLSTGESPHDCKLLNSRLSLEMGTDPILSIPFSDNMLVRYNFEKTFKVTIPKRHEWANNPPKFDPNSITWYTDGSKTNHGVGAGVYCKKPRVNISVSLGEYSSVFQAEVHAIELCIRENLRMGYSNRKIFILSDSKAAILALHSYQFKSKLVWDCLKVLKELANRNIVTLVWVPGHMGILGNEAADLLAREGSEASFTLPTPFCGIPLSTAKTAINKWLLQTREDNWHSTLGCTHAKKFIPFISRKRTTELLSLKRNQVRLLTNFLTGHCHLNYHLSKFDRSLSSTCRICSEDEETASHILCECAGLSYKRFRSLGHWFPTPSDISSSPLKKILKFISNLNFSNEL